MEIKIRPATINDLEDIKKLNAMLFQNEYDNFDQTLDLKWPFGQEADDYFKKRIAGDGCALIACIDDKTVGYLAGGFHQFGPFPGMAESSYRTLPNFSELENMCVVEEHRGKGIGTKLCQEFLTWSKAKGAVRMSVLASANNPETVNFYRKNGFIDYDLILEKDI